MVEPQRESNARTTIRSVAYMLVVLAPIAALEPRMLFVLAVAIAVQIGALCVSASPAIGAWLIWATVRWFNERDDPRRAKPPPAP
jgi:hypothetical protein